MDGNLLRLLLLLLGQIPSIPLNDKDPPTWPTISLLWARWFNKENEKNQVLTCGSLLFIPMHINLLTGCKAFAIASTREAQEEGLCASLPRSHPPSLLLLLPNSIQFNSIDKIGYLVWCELELYRCSTAVIWISLTCRCLTRGQGWTRIDQTNH